MTTGYDDDGRFLHYCHCGSWGAFGFGVSLLKGRPGVWFCNKHVGEANPEEIAVEQQKAPHMPIPIPARFRALCEFCGQELNTQATGVHQWTSGWVMQRAGGGGHGISLPERSNRWAHRYCVENAVRGGPQQQSLL